MVQMEALHMWRVCATHDIFLMHLDDAFGALCHLFSNPVLTEHTLQAASTSSAAAKKALLLRQTKLEASCQAFLLLSSLVQHAVQ